MELNLFWARISPLHDLSENLFLRLQEGEEKKGGGWEDEGQGIDCFLCNSFKDHTTFQPSLNIILIYFSV